jgi:hypothetical protein
MSPSRWSWAEVLDVARRADEGCPGPATCGGGSGYAQVGLIVATGKGCR